MGSDESLLTGAYQPESLNLVLASTRALQHQITVESKSMMALESGFSCMQRILLSQFCVVLASPSPGTRPFVVRIHCGSDYFSRAMSLRCARAS